MQADTQQVERLVTSAVEDLSAEYPGETPIRPTPETRLLGPDGIVDSIELVNLIVLVEQKVRDTFQTAVILADERAMSLARSPFRSVRSLVDHVVSRLGECEA